MDINLIFVIILFILAISDLVVGVSNDASNFLNSAIGSKVAPFKTILFIAGLGIFVGATFSSGMMEIARSGIFHPEKFFFSEIMIIFLAVMITDVILLDTFNTFGLPTSTTVSIVFELLGAAVAVSIIKITNSHGSLGELSNYINSAKALAIISGILLSVVIAFTGGMIIQFITRLIFSFNYERYMKYFGALWGGVAITAIIYFMLVKGAKGASFITEETILWINENTSLLLLYCFLSITVLLQFLFLVFRVNILKIIVLAGTFSLAMAFAGNDLVNFIGVPLAGFESYKEAIADPTFNPDTFTMEALKAPVNTPTYFLLIAGTIMVITLFLSKKARTVSQTEISLARQGSGAERFSSSKISRTVVRGSVGVTKLFSRIIPPALISFLENRFDPNIYSKKTKDKKEVSSFDQLRASVNMFVASILIATATSLKLPLSTTYVTFMVAMGTSLSDRAWGRDSAVFRITGVTTVIGGWFFTAIIAFSSSAVVALLLNWGGIIATSAALCIALIFVVRTSYLHTKKLRKQVRNDEFDNKETLNGENIMHKCITSVKTVVSAVPKLYHSTVLSLIKEDRKKMKKTISNVEELNLNAKELKYNIYPVLKKLEEDSFETGHFYVQILDYTREMAHCIRFISDTVYEYIDNNHPPLHSEQVKDLYELSACIDIFFEETLQLTNKQKFKDINKLLIQQQSILDLIAKNKKKLIKFIKSDAVGTRNTLMYLNVLSETKNLILYTINMVKSYRDFLIN